MLNQLHELRSYRGFSSLAISRFISNTGNGISPIALAYGVLGLKGADGGDLSLVMSARYFPLIALMLFGGVLADRVQRNKIVGGSDVIGGFVVAISSIALIQGRATITLLVAMGAIFGVLAALWWPAMPGVLPQILPKEKLKDGNAVIGLLSNIGYVAGTLAGGILVSAFNPGWALLVDAISFLTAGIIVWNISFDSNERIESLGLFSELRHGWREFISRPWLVTMVVTFALINSVYEALLQVLGPLNFKSYSDGPRLWSWNLAGLTAGMMVGGVLILRKRFSRPLFLSMIAISLTAIWDFSLAFDLPVALTILAAFLAGIAVEIFMVTWATTMQTHIPEESFSRVSSYDTFGSYGIAPLGIVAAGPLAMHFGVNTILIATGLITVVASLLSLTVKSVRQLTN